MSCADNCFLSKRLMQRAFQILWRIIFIRCVANKVESFECLCWKSGRSKTFLSVSTSPGTICLRIGVNSFHTRLVVSHSMKRCSKSSIWPHLTQNSETDFIPHLNLRYAEVFTTLWAARQHTSFSWPVFKPL